MSDRTKSRSALLMTLASLLAASAAISGCSKAAAGGSGGSGGTSNAPDPYANITGNWEIQATATTGGTPFTVLSGNFYEIAVNAPAHQTTAALLVQSAGCYANAGTIPLKGNVEQPKIILTSFEVNGQYLTLTAQKDLAGDTFTGTYSIQGGCADGDTGTITGTRYSNLTGTYAGKLTSDATKAVSLSLTQDGLGTGGGTALMSGSGTFTGFPCFSKGTVAGAGVSYVSGSSATLTFNTNEAGGSQLNLVGNLNPSASTLTLTSIEIVGGGCAGTYGKSTLALQS